MRVNVRRSWTMSGTNYDSRQQDIRIFQILSTTKDSNNLQGSSLFHEMIFKRYQGYWLRKCNDS